MAIAAALLLGAAIRLDQYALRWRGERLQSDIRSLELRKSTYADARAVIDRWSSDERQKGPCRADWCDAEITLNRGVLDEMAVLWKHSILINSYLWLGGRAAMITASVRVRNNIVVQKEIDEYVGGTCERDNNGQILCTDMIGMVGAEGHRRISPLHPEYNFWAPSGCEICVFASAAYTPYADPADVRRLTDLNFSCITSWHPCETQQEILPVWKQKISESGTLPEREDFCTSDMIRALSREQRRIPLAQIASEKRVGDGIEVTVRLVDDPAPELELALPHPDWREPRDYSYTISKTPYPLRIGGRVLSFGEACLPVPATDENLKAAQQGVSEADIDPTVRAFLPFGNINPPNVEVH